MFRYVTKHRPLSIYSVLALLILGPLLLPGYVLTLDMVFTPQLPAPTYISSSYLFTMLLHVLNVALPADLIQKMLLLTIFLLAGLGMHRLIAAFDVIYGSDKRLHTVAPYVAGVFYTLNPFTYDRLMAGQYAVLLGYALLPWFLRAVLLFTGAASWRTAGIIVLWALGISIVSIHSIVPMVIVGGLLLAAAFWRYRHDRRRIAALVRWCAVMAGAWIVASSYWLWPLLKGQGATAATVQSFTSNDRLAFQTVGATIVERIGNVLGLQGFWGESHGLFDLPQDQLPAGIWQLCSLVVLGLAISGVVVLWRRRQRTLVATLAVTFGAGLLLAAGIGSNWLADYVPLFAGYREPQKFAVLVALVYGVCIAYAADAMLRWALAKPKRHGRKLAYTLAALMLTLPYTLAPTMPWGATGQLWAVHYPTGWATVLKTLHADDGNHGKVLALPWHLYLNIDFARRVVANPVPKYFAGPYDIISSTDAEIKGAAQSRPTDDTRQADAMVQSALQAPEASQTFGQRIASLGVDYVILTKNSDFGRYGFLERQANMERLYDDEDITLYRVRNDSH